MTDTVRENIYMAAETMHRVGDELLAGEHDNAFTSLSLAVLCLVAALNELYPQQSN